MSPAEADLRDVLRRNGFVPCDIAACNCGSWHARYGLPERMDEIKQALADAGHPLSNENGNLTLNALTQLVVERDALRARCEAGEALLREVCGSLKFHQEQTRPIHGTTISLGRIDAYFKEGGHG
jgi:hypothetical protein